MATIKKLTTFHFIISINPKLKSPKTQRQIVKMTFHPQKALNKELTISMFDNMRRNWSRITGLWLASGIDSDSSELNLVIFSQTSDLHLKFLISFWSLQIAFKLPFSPIGLGLHNVMCDGGASITGWWRPFDVAEGIIIISYLRGSRLAGRICVRVKVIKSSLCTIFPF